MDTQESIMVFIKEQLSALELLRPNNILHHLDFAKTIHDCLYNYITDASTSPESILDLFKTLGRDYSHCQMVMKFDGFVTATFLESIALRRPKVLDESWEALVWHVIDSIGGYIIMDDYESKGIMSFKCFKEWIPMYCSPKSCPNPSLRLELFSFMTFYDFGDNVTCKESFIITLFELHDRYTSLKETELVDCAACDVKGLMQRYSLDIGSILKTDSPKANKERIIEAVIKITKMFVELEEDRINDDIGDDEIWCNNLVNSCLHFLGLIPDLKNSVDLMNFADFVTSSSLLQEYVADILGSVNDNISYLFGEHDEKDMKINQIISALVSSETRLQSQKFSSSLRDRELKGSTPQIMHQMTFFTYINFNRDSTDPITRNKIFYTEYTYNTSSDEDD